MVLLQTSGRGIFFYGNYTRTCLAQASLPAVPKVLFTSPGIVWVLFFSFTEQPKSPSLISPDEVRKMLAPRKHKETQTHLFKTELN